MAQESVILYNQGYCYYTGTNGFPLNYYRALDCFKKAAALGNSSAMNYLGVMYQYGQNVNQDFNAAADWYYKALQADNRNAYAAHNLAGLYYYGNGVQKNLAKSYELYKAAVNLGAGNTTTIYPNSCYMTGLILLTYYKNYKAAVDFFLDAAKYGNLPEAWHNLGWLCEQGAMEVSKSDIPETALGFYKNAAESGYAQSMDAVGRLYASFQMLDEAREWIKKAADMGYEPAKKRLRALNVAQSGSLWDLIIK